MPSKSRALIYPSARRCSSVALHFNRQRDSLYDLEYLTLAEIAAYPLFIVFVLKFVGVDLLAEFTEAVVGVELVADFTKKAILVFVNLRSNLFEDLFGTTLPVETYAAG